MSTGCEPLELPPTPVTGLTARRTRRWASRYRLIRLHCVGGLGRVYVVHDRVLERDVALKELRPQHDANHFARSLFLREARITSHLEHPNIVPVYDQSATNSLESPYYTMRLVRGAPLSKSIDQFHLERAMGLSNRRHLRGLLEAFIECCRAVAYAHARAVIHRDLKPSNILIGQFGEVVVLDWGSAKILNQPHAPCFDLETDDQKHASAIVGTPAYMAPEQAAGCSKHIDRWTDVYGLGAVLYDILTGQPPHGTRSTQHHTPSTWTLESRASAPLRLEPPDFEAFSCDTPPELSAICRKMLAENPGDRYPTVTCAAEDVDHWLADDPLSVCAQPLTRRCTRKSAARHSMRRAAGTRSSRLDRSNSRNSITGLAWDSGLLSHHGT